MKTPPIGLGTQLRRLLALLDTGVQRTYDEHGVPFQPRFYPIVRLLLSGGPASVGEIARDVGVSQPAITQSLDRMQASGLIKPEPSADHRARRVGLTEQGVALAVQLEEIWTATHEAAEALDRELPNALSETIDRAIARLEARSFDERIAEAFEEKRK